jgi:hypothetical protein
MDNLSIHYELSVGSLIDDLSADSAQVRKNTFDADNFSMIQVSHAKYFPSLAASSLNVGAFVSQRMEYRCGCSLESEI